MKYRDQEKRRLNSIKTSLFSPEACFPGTYNGKTYDFCLADKLSSENLYQGIRSEAIEYFNKRKIPWHKGIKNGALPSNHLCCSQTACVNFLFRYRNQPNELMQLLKLLGYNAENVLPILNDFDSSSGFIGFEWIGQKNYLNELSRGKIANDERRSRGKGFTSADFVIRFKQTDGYIHLILGEWKYTEFYQINRSIRYARSGRDRLQIYRRYLEQTPSQIKFDKLTLDTFFFDPFDQLMRLQLLATEAEKFEEMDASIVSLLHIAPNMNKELVTRITSPNLKHYGTNIHEIWRKITLEGRFRGVWLEDLILKIQKSSQDHQWTNYISTRYSSTMNI